MIYIYPRLLSGVRPELWAHELGRCVAMHLSHTSTCTKTLVLAGVWTERKFHSSLLWENGRKKSHTFFYAGARTTNYFLNFFYVVSTDGGWIMIARKLSLLVFWPLFSYQTTPIRSGH